MALLRLGGWTAALLSAVGFAIALSTQQIDAATATAAAALWLLLALLASPLEASACVVTAALPFYGVGWFQPIGTAAGLLTVLLALLVVTSAYWARDGWRRVLLAPRAWLFVAFAVVVVASLVLAPRGPNTLELAKRYLAREFLLPLALAATLIALGKARSSVLARRLGLVTIAVAGIGAVLSVVQVGSADGYLQPPGDNELHLAQFVGLRAIGLAEAPGTWAAFLLIALGFGLALLVYSQRPAERSWIGTAVFMILLALALSGLRSAWLAVALMLLVTLVAVGSSRPMRFAAVVLAVAAALTALQFDNFRLFLNGAGTAEIRETTPGKTLTASEGSNAGSPEGGSQSRARSGNSEVDRGQPDSGAGSGASVGQSQARSAEPELGRGRLGADESARQRIAITKAELELGRRHPIFGVGLGNVGVALGELPPRFYGPSTGLVPGIPIEKHNVYAGLFAELGLPGALLFIALLATGLWGLFRLRQATPPGPDRATIDGIALAVVGTAVVAVFTEADRQVFLWWLLGLALGLTETYRRSAETRIRT